MSSVTARIKEIKQPRGGYIKLSQFATEAFDDGRSLSEAENVHAIIVGLAVDYLTRFMSGTPATEAFSISLNGAKMAETMFGRKDYALIAYTLATVQVKGLDDASIIAACKLATFDVWFRNTMGAMLAKTYDETEPDAATIENIRIMVERSMAFWSKCGPVVKGGFTFEPNGYTKTVDSGDGDYLTADTLWDFKVSKAKPTVAHTLQILMYWIMGRHSGQDVYTGIKNIGIFNPRLNTMYRLAMDAVPGDTIKAVEQDVICY